MNMKPKQIAILPLTLITLSCASPEKGANQSEDAIAALSTKDSSGSSKDKFECIVKDQKESCRAWFQKQTNLDLGAQPIVLLQKLCPSISPASCEAISDHPDFAGDQDLKLMLLKSACDGSVKRACEKSKALSAKIESERKAREKAEALERARVAAEEKKERLKKEAEERAERAREAQEMAKTVKIAALESKCDSGNSKSCLNVAALIGNENLDRAWRFFKKACETGSISTCQTIGKGSLKRNDTENAIFAYSHMCEKDVPASCSTLIELRRLQSEENGRRAQLEMMEAQLKFQKRQAFEENMARLRAAQQEDFRNIMSGLQQAFQPVQVAPIAPAFKMPQQTRCVSRTNMLGEVETNCQDGY